MMVLLISSLISLVRASNSSSLFSSTGRFCIHISSDDEGGTTIDPMCQVTPGERKMRLTTTRRRRKRVMGRKTIPKTTTWTRKATHLVTCPKKKKGGWEYRDNDMASRDIINSQRMAICLDEPREAQYMAGFIALQMSKMWGMFEGGEKRTIEAAVEGTISCPYHNDFGKYPNITEIDQEGILMPSTEQKVTQSQNVRTRTFRTMEERNQHIRYLVSKCEGLYIFYKLWIAAKILDITKDEMKLLVKDRIHPVGDIVYRCFSLAFNCKYIYIYIVHKGRLEPWQT